MPFTFSHPSAVLPLAYLPTWCTSMTGLVIGSIAPDFEYFITMKVYSLYSHTWTGMFWFDLPLTIILTFTFHLYVRNSLIDNLPSFITVRLSVFKSMNWTQHFKQNFIVVIASVLFGIATHILWDSFTHEHGQFVLAVDGLKEPFKIAGHSIPAYKLLQHISTVIGGLVIIYALLKLPSYKDYEKQKPSFSYWLSVSAIALIVVIRQLLTGLDYKLYGNVIVTAISGMLIGLVVTPLFITPRNYNSR